MSVDTSGFLTNIQNALDASDGIIGTGTETENSDFSNTSAVMVNDPSSLFFDTEYMPAGQLSGPFLLENYMTIPSAGEAAVLDVYRRLPGEVDGTRTFSRPLYVNSVARDRIPVYMAFDYRYEYRFTLTTTPLVAVNNVLEMDCLVFTPIPQDRVLDGSSNGIMLDYTLNTLGNQTGEYKAVSVIEEGVFEVTGDGDSLATAIVTMKNNYATGIFNPVSNNAVIFISTATTMGNDSDGYSTIEINARHVDNTNWSSTQTGGFIVKGTVLLDIV